MPTGRQLTKAKFKANAQWLAKHLKSSGWQYVVVDMEWFVTNPHAAKATPPNPNSAWTSKDDIRRPSIAFRLLLAARVSSRSLITCTGLGLKFGIHILRGIPKKAVEQESADRGLALSCRGCRGRSRYLSLEP